MRLNRLFLFIFSRSFSVNSHATRSHTCGQLRLKDVGTDVTLLGWLSFRRLNRFIVLRDAYGSVQATVKDGDKKHESIVCDIPYESIVRVKGKVKDRGENRNTKMDTGEIEIEVSSLEVVNPAQKELPLLPGNESHESTRLKYRYIDLRSKKLQDNLRMRSEVVHAARRFLVEQKSFVDVETPTLFRRTPGGAAEFIVPTRNPSKGLAYSLPQSPQQFKQLLMVGGMDRYFQIARCYRDEGSKLDRQPEFTQIDIEMSYPTQESLIDLLEQLLLSAWPSSLKDFRPSAPFPRLSYASVMKDYGIDKPDLRIPWKIEEVNTDLFDRLRSNAEEKDDWVIRCIKGKGGRRGVTKGKVREWTRLTQMNARYTPFTVVSEDTKKGDTNEGKGWFKFIDDERIGKEFDMEEDDVVILSWGRSLDVQWTLGQLRNYLGESLGLRAGQSFSPLWVVDFPLFERDPSSHQLVSTHHPFTAPIDQHLHLLQEGRDLETIRAQHFDLVLNGVELGGGSIRIHNGDLQRKVLSILNESTEEMTHLLEALSSGAPPHGGFAFGLDRLIALFAGRGNTAYGIRDVIAFPKTKEGRDVMVDTPIVPSKEQLFRYGFSIDRDN